MDQFKLKIHTALINSAPLDDLVGIARVYRDASQEDMIKALEDIRAFDDITEEKDDLILDLLDCVYGNVTEQYKVFDQ